MNTHFAAHRISTLQSAAQMDSPLTLFAARNRTAAPVARAVPAVDVGTAATRTLSNPQFAAHENRRTAAVLSRRTAVLSNTQFAAHSNRHSAARRNLRTAARWNRRTS